MKDIVMLFLVVFSVMLGVVVGIPLLVGATIMAFRTNVFLGLGMVALNFSLVLTFITVMESK